MNQSPEENAARFAVHVTAESHFSWIRTRLSVERTLMAWVRTSIAMIGFGFTIYQFFERLRGAPDSAVEFSLDAPRYIGLALIGGGILALGISLWQYNWSIRYLWSEPYRPIAGARSHAMQTPIVALAILLMLIGFAAFIIVLFRAP